MGRGRTRVTSIGLMGLVLLSVALSACSSGPKPSASSSSSGAPGDSVPLVAGGNPARARYLVYWDQNEEEDFLSMP